jgi:hypothetical protein
VIDKHEIIKERNFNLIKQYVTRFLTHNDKRYIFHEKNLKYKYAIR